MSSNWNKKLPAIGYVAVILMEGGTVYDLQVLDGGKKEETKPSGTLYSVTNL